jgi:hypothetical protein
LHGPVAANTRDDTIDAVPEMRTPDGEWRVEVIRSRGGQVFRVRRRAVIGARGGRGWAPIGQIRRTVGEVAELLGDAFGEFVDANLILATGRQRHRSPRRVGHPRQSDRWARARVTLNLRNDRPAPAPVPT